MFQAGEMVAERAEDLEALGMVWEPGEVAWEENLAAARVYYAQRGTLAAPVTATALDKPVGRWLANCRKPGGLGKDPEVAARRAAALAAIDPDWRPAWPVDWQRSFAGVEGLVAMGAGLEEVVPGVTVDGVDVGRWLERQRQALVWKGLAEGQRARLEALGVVPLPPEPRKAVRASGKRAEAFERGCAALAQYRERTGTVRPVSRSHVEVLAGPDGAEVEVKLGVWLANVKSRRATLTTGELERLAGLGLEWAVAV